MEETIILTDNGKIVLSYMQEHDQILVGKDIGASTGIKGNGVYKVLDSLKRRELVRSEEPIIRDFTNNKGEVKPKEYKTYALTDKGRAFEIN